MIRSGYKVNNKLKVLLCVGFIVCISAIFYYWGSMSNRTSVDDNGAVTATVGEFEEEQIIEENESQPGIEIPGYDRIYLEEMSTKLRGDFYNPEKNNVYFRLSFLLSETNELIYQSKMIKPGQHLYEVELLRGLDKGEYQMSIVYETYSADENLTPRNGATVDCVLVVE